MANRREMSNITIIVKTSKDTKEITFAKKKTVKELRKKVAELFSIELDRACLIFSGKILKDEDSLSQKKIKNYDTLHLAVQEKETSSNAQDSSSDDEIVASPYGGFNFKRVKPVFSDDSKFLLCASGSLVKIVNCSQGEVIQILNGHTQPITGIDLDCYEPAKYCYTVSSDNSLIKWDYIEGKALKGWNVKNLETLKCVRGLLYSIQGTQQKNIVKLAIKNDEINVATVHNIEGKDNLEERYSFGNRFSFLGFVNNWSCSVLKLNDTNEVPKRWSYVNCPLRCISCHPESEVIATGDVKGAIFIWRKIFSEAPVTLKLHWHSLPVCDLAWNSHGTELLSVGYECVLVRWTIATEEKRFLPRLGAPLNYVRISRNNQSYALSHDNNVLTLVTNNLLVQKVISGMADNGNKLNLIYDPRSRCIITNGLPGHLQFYKIEDDKQLYYIDAVGQNYISPESLDKPLKYIEVESAVVNSTGTWLCTYERRDDASLSIPSKLKFWRWSAVDRTFIQCVEYISAFRGKVNALSFCKSIMHEVLVATSEDSCFKIWMNNGESKWVFHRQGSHLSLPSKVADFSKDGSLLAVSFRNYLTLWRFDEDLERKAILEHESSVSFCEFCKFKYVHILLSASDNQIISWDLLTCSALWKVNINVSLLASDPLSEYFAVLSTNNQLYIIQPSEIEPAFSLSNVCKSEVSSMVFVPRENVKDDLPDWASKSQLYFWCKGEGLFLVDKPSSELTKARKRINLSSSVKRNKLAELINHSFSRKDLSNRDKRIDRFSEHSASNVLLRAVSSVSNNILLINDISPSWQAAALKQLQSVSCDNEDISEDLQKLEIDEEKFHKAILVSNKIRSATENSNIINQMDTVEIPEENVEKKNYIATSKIPNGVEDILKVVM